MQQLTCKMVWPFSFYSPLFLREGLILRESAGGKSAKKVWKCVTKCRNDFALKWLPFSFSLIH